MRSSKNRSRSKGNRNRSVGNVVNRVFDSSGPEGKVRGTPQQIIDKYNQLARDAQLGNDRVAAENFQQHAEHYLRMLGEAQREQEARREQQQNQQPQNRGGQGRGDGEAGGDSSGGDKPFDAVMDGGPEGGSGPVDTPEDGGKPQRSRSRSRRKPDDGQGRADEDGSGPDIGDGGPDNSPQEAAE
ncbi:MAG: DUF4167 domain-containing protein [Rhodobacteraceae bacterium]|jgi:hypothetical protein|nr:DUF4167 domain-containing protein [Paracoccaceae bacterium]